MPPSASALVIPPSVSPLRKRGRDELLSRRQRLDAPPPRRLRMRIDRTERIWAGRCGCKSPHCMADEFAFSSDTGVSDDSDESDDNDGGGGCSRSGDKTKPLPPRVEHSNPNPVDWASDREAKSQRPPQDPEDLVPMMLHLMLMMALTAANALCISILAVKRRTRRAISTLIRPMPIKKPPSAHPSPSAAKVGPKASSTSPIHTPAISELGGGSTPYQAATNDRREFEDLEGRGPLRRDESEMETTSGPDVEMRSAADLEQQAKAARNRRLTLLQLERFRRAVAVNKAKHTRGSSSSRWENKARRGEGFDSIFSQNPDGSPGALRELRIVNYPWAMWLLGCVLIIAASVFVDHIHKQALKKRHQGVPEGSVNWWKYLVAGIIYLASALVIANARVENFSMNKETSTLSIRSTKALCVVPTLRRTRVVDRELRQIIDVRVEASGEILSGEVDTRAYKVHFDFDDGTYAVALESRSRSKVLVRCRLIKQFLLSCAPPEPLVGSPLAVSDSGSEAAASPLAMAGPAASPGLSIVLPARSPSSNLTLAVPAPLSTAAAAMPSPRRVMMVAAVPSSLSQKFVGVGQQEGRLDDRRG